MTESELREEIIRLGINKTIPLHITYLENGETITKIGNINYNRNETPTINEGRVSISVVLERGKNPRLYPGGLELKDLQAIALA